MLQKLDEIIATFNLFPESYGCNVFRCYEACKKLVYGIDDYIFYTDYIIRELEI